MLSPTSEIFSPVEVKEVLYGVTEFYAGFIAEFYLPTPISTSAPGNPETRTELPRGTGREKFHIDAGLLGGIPSVGSAPAPLVKTSLTAVLLRK